MASREQIESVERSEVEAFFRDHQLDVEEGCYVDILVKEIMIFMSEIPCSDEYVHDLLDDFCDSAATDEDIESLVTKLSDKDLGFNYYAAEILHVINRTEDLYILAREALVEGDFDEKFEDTRP